MLFTCVECFLSEIFGDCVVVIGGLLQKSVGTSIRKGLLSECWKVFLLFLGPSLGVQ